MAPVTHGGYFISSSLGSFRRTSQAEEEPVYGIIRRQECYDCKYYISTCRNNRSKYHTCLHDINTPIETLPVRSTKRKQLPRKLLLLD